MWACQICFATLCNTHKLWIFAVPSMKHLHMCLNKPTIHTDVTKGTKQRRQPLPVHVTTKKVPDLYRVIVKARCSSRKRNWGMFVQSTNMFQVTASYKSLLAQGRGRACCRSMGTPLLLYSGPKMYRLAILHLPLASRLSNFCMTLSKTFLQGVCTEVYLFWGPQLKAQSFALRRRQDSLLASWAWTKVFCCPLCLCGSTKINFRSANILLIEWYHISF